jgi:hypothetical protein
VDGRTDRVETETDRETGGGRDRSLGHRLREKRVSALFEIGDLKWKRDRERNTHTHTHTPTHRDRQRGTYIHGGKWKNLWKEREGGEEEVSWEESF